MEKVPYHIGRLNSENCGIFYPGESIKILYQRIQFTETGFQVDACSMSLRGGGESDQSEGDVSSKHLMENVFNPVPFCLFSFYCDQFEIPKFVL